MPNIKQIISSPNSALLHNNSDNPADTQQNNCNCRSTKVCPLDGKCLEKGIIYQATVKREDNNKEETYVGLTENSFKTRFNNHTCSFRNEKKRTCTTLSQYVWLLQDKNVKFSVKWKILAKGKSYSTSSEKCYLCLKEKYFIICNPQLATLNNRNELGGECKHRKKSYFLKLNRL